jgi:hypothetical protein
MSHIYQPIDELHPVADDIWIVDGDIIRFFGAPFPTRMTVVRLSSGELFVHSPTAYSPALAQRVAALGPVAHLVSPNWIHYAFIPKWAEAFPNAKVWASPGVRARAAKAGVDPNLFDEDLGDEAPEDWRGDIEQCIAHGSKVHVEVVFFHVHSRTLILTDLIENFERDKVSWPFRVLGRFAGILDPDGRAPLDMRMTFRGGREQLRKAVQRMIDWGQERVILAHGRWYRERGVEELRRAFRWVL